MCNYSLSALADVMVALAENRTHIPYRNTKLTHVLQDTIGKSSYMILCMHQVPKSIAADLLIVDHCMHLLIIGGDAKLLVMLCVSPVQKFITETLQCLGFGSRARQVARGQVKKRRGTVAPLQQSIGTLSSVFSLRVSGASH